MSHTTDITVRYVSGAYVTGTVQKQRASCTAGPEQAARALGEKLFGASFSHVEQLGHDMALGQSQWRIQAKEHYAFCWQSGLIEFGRMVPAGALKFAKGMDKQLRLVVGTVARHGQGKSTNKLLVPGVPEAAGNKRVDALMAWQKKCARGDGKEGRFGVVFGGAL